MDIMIKHSRRSRSALVGRLGLLLPARVLAGAPQPSPALDPAVVKTAPSKAPPGATEDCPCWSDRCEVLTEKAQAAKAYSKKKSSLKAGRAVLSILLIGVMVDRRVLNEFAQVKAEYERMESDFAILRAKALRLKAIVAVDGEYWYTLVEGVDYKLP